MTVIDKKIEVDERLSRVLRHFYFVKIPENEETSIQHLSPSLEMLLIFNFGEPVSFSLGNEKIGKRTIGRVAILGPLRQMLNYERKPGTDLMSLAFIYDGFYRFQSLSRQQPGIISFDEEMAFRNAEYLNQIWETLMPLEDPMQRARVVQDFLLRNLTNPEPAANTLLDNVDTIYDPVIKPVSVMAERASVSDRTIQKRFRKYVGYSTKELLRFLRFKAVVHFILENQDGKTDWFEIIHTYNYHDQSHLIKDFKYFTGVTPRQFVKLNAEGSFCLSRD